MGFKIRRGQFVSTDDTQTGCQKQRGVFVTEAGELLPQCVLGTFIFHIRIHPVIVLKKRIGQIPVSQVVMNLSESFSWIHCSRVVRTMQEENHREWM